MPEEVVDDELQQDTSIIGSENRWLVDLWTNRTWCRFLHTGEGTRAAVLFHEPSFDTAAVLLEPGGKARVRCETHVSHMFAFFAFLFAYLDKLKLFGSLIFWKQTRTTHVSVCPHGPLCDKELKETNSTGRAQRLTKLTLKWNAWMGSHLNTCWKQARPGKLGSCEICSGILRQNWRCCTSSRRQRTIRHTWSCDFCR